MKISNAIPFNSLLNNKNQQWQVSIFPNPASEEINISCSENENLNLEIRDVTGKVVLKKVIVIENNLHQFKVDLKSGIYFVNLINTNGQQFSQKLIITK
ncbi:MAG: T9SS type A sorting domain-containing protein [Bacteroidia bacterium]|nr:T9SS type A sorting domain-containing protein [Bacteroidia bacterium]